MRLACPPVEKRQSALRVPQFKKLIEQPGEHAPAFFLSASFRQEFAQPIHEKDREGKEEKTRNNTLIHFTISLSASFSVAILPTSWLPSLANSAPSSRNFLHRAYSAR